MTIIQTIENNHNCEKKITPHVNQIQHDELTILVIKHPLCHAAISLQGAHLLYWQPKSEPYPVIWLSDKTPFKKGVAIRGGIPICWPWFSNVNTPSHGFARIVDWNLHSCTENDHGVEVILTLNSNEETKKYWTHDFVLEMKFHLGKTCKAELSSQGDFEATSALHTYFGISDINAITVTGLGDVYHEKVATPNEPKVIGEMTFDQEVDRIYTHPQAVTPIKDAKRTINIHHFNHSDIVTWNPWIEKAKAMKDIDDISYRHFVCVETGRIFKPIVASSQQKVTYGVEIEVIKSA